MVISGEKAVEQLGELLVLMINSFEGVKDVIKFMSFEELEIVGFQTQTALENKGDQIQVNETIGIGDLDDPNTEDKLDDSKTLDKESMNSDDDPMQFHEKYKKQREELRNNKNNDKLELSAIIKTIKNKHEEIKHLSNNKADPDLNSTGHNEVFNKFTKTNFIKGRKPKLHKQLNLYSKHEEDVRIGKNVSEISKLDKK